VQKTERGADITIRGDIAQRISIFMTDKIDDERFKRADYRRKVPNSDDHFGLEPDKNEYESNPLLIYGKPCAPDANRLAVSRSASPQLGNDEEAELIRKAIALDRLSLLDRRRLIPNKAGCELVLRHSPFMRAAARKRWDQLNPLRRMEGTVDLNPPGPERSVQYEDL
jgi:hypothetical protein